MATAPQSGTEPSPGFTASMNRFWQRVTEGMELSQLWTQFRTEARSSFHLYKRDFDAQSPQKLRPENFLHKAQEFAWALLEKLTPARRVLFLAGILLLIIPEFNFAYHQGKATEFHATYLDFHFYGGMLLFVLLLLETSDRVVMKRDLQIARDIQRWLLPSQTPQVPGMQIAFATRPANTVAGDYYDVFPRPGHDGHFFLVVADVAGKSIPAALLMATLQASLRTLSGTSSTIPELINALNRYVCTNSQGGLRFTTAFLAEFDASSRTLTYINAGHNNPVLRRTSGEIERLSDGGLPLGIQEDAAYGSGNVVLNAGDWLLIFTDGLVEAMNTAEEEYGEARMLQMLNSGIASTPDQLLRQMMTNLDAFVGATPQHDDVTCLLIKVG